MQIHHIKNLPLLILRKVVNTFFGLFAKKIGKANLREAKVIKEVNNIINRKFNSKSDIEATNFYLQRIRNMLLKGNIRKFIRYDVVLNSLFVQNRFYLIKEYKYVLKNLKNKKNINEDKIGSPIPFFLNFDTSGNRVHHLYHILKFSSFFGNKDLKNIDIIFDWGGGYGSMCHLFYRLGFKGTYIIYDFDELYFLQLYYLKSLGHKVNFGNKIKKNHINLINNKNSIKKYLLNNKIKNKLFVSCWAMSETEKSLRTQFDYVFKLFDNILLGFQEKYFGINNFRYFKSRVKLKKNRKILIEKNNNNFENHYYIFTKKS
tara:strand:+ start:641 stop:1591 length:951 start_codon:yes stop_codon:yes gene_type:complete